MTRTCVIAQPTFLPWAGWFDLADQADVMVILDDVAFSKQSWQQRNRIRTQAGLEYLSVPVRSSGRFGQLIADCELANRLFAGKMLRSIRANYAKAPHFTDLYPELETVMEAAAATDRLADLNCGLIGWLAKKLDVTTPMIRSSKLGVGGQRGEHVASICGAVQADVYLSPASAAEYLREDNAFFDRRGIAVMLHVFEHPVYRQRFEPFMPYASALDLILNAGPAAAEIMRSGRRSSRPLRDESVPSASKGTCQ